MNRVRDARARIDLHRLMQGIVSSDVGGGRRVPPARAKLRLRGVLVHGGAFMVACLMAIGVTTALAFLWARPNDPWAVVCTGVAAACAFVASYAYVHVRHAPSSLEEGSSAPHVGHSIVYGILALIFALCSAALIARAAPAFVGIG